LWFAVTRNPTAEWLSRQITEAFPWDSAPKYLIRDNDRAFGGVFKARLRTMGIRDRPTSFHSPWQNGHVERLIGSARRECTDHLIVFNAEHLRRLLAKYAAHYNGVRTHVSLGKDAPCTRAIERFGDIVAHPVLGGLHHRYARIQFFRSDIDFYRLIWCAVVALFQSRAGLQAEILVLRHQLNVLRRKAPKRVTFSAIDRLLLQALYRLAPGVLDALKFSSRRQ
jgi:hypothetical protein